MARLRDVAPVLKRVGFVKYWKGVWQQCNEDGVFTWASALAYSWLFAVFPFLVFLLALVPYVPQEGKNWLHDNLGPDLKKALPTDAYKTVWDGYLEQRLPDLLNSRPKGFLSIGLILAIWGASGGVAMTLRALDQCYDVDCKRSFYRIRLKSMFLTIIEAIFMLAVAVLLPVATTLRVWVQNYLAHLNPPILIPDWGLWLFEITRLILALICMFCAVGLIYYFGPNVKQRFRLITPGAVFCVIVWITLGSLFRLYINTFGKYQQTYGPVGGVVILLLLFYLDAMVLLIGAEINSEIDFVALNLKPGATDFRGKPWDEPHQNLNTTLAK
jgi:membrane protein